MENNIHILPTDKPSRLYIDNKGKYYLEIGQVDFKTFQNIYITNDEEIENCWIINLTNNEIGYVKNNIGIQKNAKKIILTTDQDLIKDGVQAIDDEFLEWFVKNPSCEEVDVEEEDYSQKCRECGETVKRGYNCNRGCFMKSGNFILTDKNIKYKIIIPKEENIYDEYLKDELKKYKNVKTIVFNKPKKETLEEDFKIWDDLFGILAWKFKPTKSGDMYLDGEKVYEELKSKFKLKRI